MGGELPERLASGLVAERLLRHDPVEVDGVPIHATLRPADAEELATLLCALREAGLAALPRGGGTRSDLGNTPRRADLLLSTQQLRGVDEFEPGEGVCHARAGTPLRELREVVEAQGWVLPLDAAEPDATLGGVLAAAAFGPRALGLGRPRDVVLGMEVVLGSGERTHCGGRVVKNVTGYDLDKLYTGSLGTLGVIAGAWLRLRPVPEEVRVLALPERATADACALGIAAARRPTARACALWSGAPDRLGGVVELAGDRPGVARDADWLAKSAGAQPAGPDRLDEAYRRQRQRPDPVGLRFRLGVAPSRLARVVADLSRPEARVASLLVQPGLGVVHAGFALADSGDRQVADAAFRCIGSLAPGAFVCESAPPPIKRGRDVFADTGDALPLMRALKLRFDPDGILNPGRFAGGL